MLTATDILGPEGRIAARLEHYEFRQQQLDMAEAVARALADGHHLIAEAGTGVGKSFAYLVPTILAAVQAKAEDNRRTRRVVISTHTISLQEQILNKDLPLLNSVIPYEFTAVLVKGRRNYLSRRRLDVALQRSKNLFHYDNEVDQLRRVREWAKTTTDGSLSDLPFRPDSSVWDEVASDSGNCLGRKCPSHRDCFYYRARRRAQNAQILVVNHALFFSDLALRQHGVKIIDDYDIVVFDEAHTVEAVAGDHLGLGVGSGQVDYVLNKLFNDRTNKGLLVHLQDSDGQQRVNECRDLAADFFADVADWRDELAPTNGRAFDPEVVPDRVTTALDHLGSKLKRLGDTLFEETDQMEVMAAHDRVVAISAEIKAWLKQSMKESVYWVETSIRRNKRRSVTLTAAPIDIGRHMREQLFNQVPNVICTSATLATGRDPSFEFFQSRVGLTQAQTVRLGSPFRYRDQVRLILVDGMADPSAERDEFEEQSARMIQRYVQQTDGHAFVLFTSYEMMRQATARLQSWLIDQNMALFSQSEGTPRRQMLEGFRNNPRSVLFGTDTFWQGVDVPGDALQNVIITKLPFSVPDHPLLQARLEAIRETGGNPFFDYQLPEAIIKLRQGFGRLIRSSRDSGIVVILDPRVRTKRYGRQFLQSLPDCEVQVDPLEW